MGQVPPERHDRSDPPAAPSATRNGNGTRRERLFGSPDFFRLWIAQVVSSMGDWMGFLAIIVVAQRVSGGEGEGAIALVMMARLLPGFFLAPLAGVLVDRWDRKRTMVICDLFRAGVLVSVPFLDSVFGLFVASLLLEVPTLLWSPAKEASVPNLVPEDKLTTANSLSLAAAYGTFPLAGGLFAVTGYVGDALAQVDVLRWSRIGLEGSAAIYLDVVTFVVAAIIVSTLNLPKVGRRRAVDYERASTNPYVPSVDAALSDALATVEAPFGDDDIRVGSTLRDSVRRVVDELKEGWQFIFINPVVRAVMLALSTGLIGGGMLVPLGPLFSAQVLGSNESDFGWLLTALGVGVSLGVLSVSALQNRLPKIWVFTGAVLGAGLSLMVGAAQGNLASASLCVAIMGIFAGAVYVLGFTLLHENVEDELRGRIFSAVYTMVRFCVILSTAVGPLLSRVLGSLSDQLFDRVIEGPGFVMPLPGVRLALWLASLIIIAAGLLAARSLRAGERAQADARRAATSHPTSHVPPEPGNGTSSPKSPPDLPRVTPARPPEPVPPVPPAPPTSGPES